MTPSPAPLTAAERRDLQALLVERQRHLRGEIKAHLRGTGDSGVVGLSSVPAETDDWGVGDELAARDIAEAKQLLSELADVEAALARSAAGTYGECVDCGEPIAPARLRAYPAATRCIACQGALEKREAGPPLTAV
ncbi:MAG: TraR/DksA family transcriptional regulator [Burkholderiales bacterium]|nr:TraR/DksA family transcriptional regulator [Burkholderiales bacterium]GIK85620.1 MAG: conjugal transfer protein TraR [Betaproteobacteria bacterium]